MTKDLKIRHNVERELDWEPSVDAREVGVAVKDGVVSLTGVVNSYREKVGAEEAAKRVVGVLGLANDIQVRLPTDEKRSDGEIAVSAVEALRADASIPPAAIRPVVNEGIVTLEGQVQWQYQRAAAEKDVRNVRGVKVVIDKITVKPKEISAPSEIREKIQDAIRRSAQLDAEHIMVETAGGKVTLRGRVRSYWEREEAETAAWAAPGITRVDNQLTIAAPVYERE